MANGKIIAVQSLVNGNGSKYITMNLAAYTMVFTKGANSVAVVDMDLLKPTVGESFDTLADTHTIDNLLDSMDAESLTDELVVATMSDLPIGIRLLRGTKDVGRAHLYYTNQYVCPVLTSLRNSFDYIFVNVASDYNNAATIYSLAEADIVVSVARNNIANYMFAGENFESKTNLIRMGVPKYLMYNLYSDSSKLEFGELSSAMQPLGLVRFEQKEVDNAHITSLKAMMRYRSKNTKVFLDAAKTLITA